ncbi:helix-turn-helix transcriptional regulator [Acidovorax sp. SUPP2522]|uniref:winged helix-turn-helix transcriptional regulator n=1 Tax=unclassified Acidovorax TaxID=2684926 RepID=UPI00234B27AD|nr:MULTISPECIES: helix-turn-helix domain-containing protein [unclassified Acidovorax]WCM96301.1 helix-turn-helix transcriptional regulator [Acidovorax sp. GBBC 1281]GKT16936.1 helix-turn-helix transcriptional regulator [Acidovorax sp. SUPP2522]
MPPQNAPTLNPTRYAYNVYEDRCPTRQVLERLADKWALLILDRLKDGPMRFNSLRREIKQITQKVLTQTLRRLERDGFIAREVQVTQVLMVEYSLTPLGETLTDTVSALAHWAETHMDAVLESQAAYDRAQQQLSEAASAIHRL